MQLHLFALKQVVQLVSFILYTFFSHKIAISR